MVEANSDSLPRILACRRHRPGYLAKNTRWSLRWQKRYKTKTQRPNKTECCSPEVSHPLMTFRVLILASYLGWPSPASNLAAYIPVPRSRYDTNHHRHGHLGPFVSDRCGRTTLLCPVRTGSHRGEDIHHARTWTAIARGRQPRSWDALQPDGKL
jgi:hypothetical protein